MKGWIKVLNFLYFIERGQITVEAFDGKTRNIENTYLYHVQN